MMPWFKVDDGFSNSRPVVRIPRRYRTAVVGLWTLAGAWSAKELTDGRIPVHMLEELCSTPSMAQHLVTAGLWEITADGWQYVGWEKYQPTRQEVMEHRDRETERKRVYRASRRDKNGTDPDARRDKGGSPDTPTRPDPTRPDPPIRPGSEGTRIPANFGVTDAMRAWHRRTAYLANIDLSTERFVNHWKSKAGRDGLKADWEAAWCNWLLADHEKNITTLQTKPGRVTYVQPECDQHAGYPLPCAKCERDGRDF